MAAQPKPQLGQLIHPQRRRGRIFRLRQQRGIMALALSPQQHLTHIAGFQIQPAADEDQ